MSDLVITFRLQITISLKKILAYLVMTKRTLLMCPDLIHIVPVPEIYLAFGVSKTRIFIYMEKRSK